MERAYYRCGDPYVERLHARLYDLGGKPAVKFTIYRPESVPRRCTDCKSAISGPGPLDCECEGLSICWTCFVPWQHRALVTSGTAHIVCPLCQRMAPAVMP